MKTDSRLKGKTAKKKPKANNALGTLTVRRVPVADLQFAAYNPKHHTQDESFHGLQASMERFGYQDPIIWNERTGNIVGGHKRAMVLRKKKVQDVDVVVVDISDDDEKALNATLNNPELETTFDTAALARLLEDIKPNMERIEYEALRFDDLEASIDFPSGYDSEVNFQEDEDTGAKKKKTKKDSISMEELRPRVIVECDSDDAEIIARRIRKILKTQFPNATIIIEGLA